MENYFPVDSLEGCQPTSRYAYDRMIERFYTYLDKPIENATVEDFNQWARACRWGKPTPTNPNPGNQTKRLALNAIRAYFREVLNLDKHELTLHSIPDIKGPNRKRLSIKEKRLAIDECKLMTKPRILIPRNLAFMELLWNTLARRRELAELLMDEVDLDRGFVRVWAKAKARKGRRKQPKKLSPRAKEALQTWLEIRPQFANPGCPFVFVTVNGGQWKPDSVGSFFKRMKARIGFTIYAHAYRGGGATDALERGIPDRLVMLQGGWESYSVFQEYTKEASLNAYGELMWGGEDEL